MTTRSVTADPLTSLDVNRVPSVEQSASDTGSPVTRPFALRSMIEAGSREIPDYTYDPARQLAVDHAGHPLAPQMKKDWTSYESTHTDGDGGDNETWGWEEV
jgi:putative ATP-grasp target RiPP